MFGAHNANKKVDGGGGGGGGGSGGGGGGGCVGASIDGEAVAAGGHSGQCHR